MSHLSNERSDFAIADSRRAKCLLRLILSNYLLSLDHDCKMDCLTSRGLKAGKSNYIRYKNVFLSKYNVSYSYLDSRKLRQMLKIIIYNTSGMKSGTGRMVMRELTNRKTCLITFKYIIAYENRLNYVHMYVYLHKERCPLF